MRTRRLVGIALIAATVLFATTAAPANPPENYQYKFNAADQAAARAAALHRSDLSDLTVGLLGADSNGKWKGGFTRPDLSPDTSTPPACRTKESDLVITGTAESTFANKRVGLAMLALYSDAEVFQTAQMARLDWQRNALMPNLNTCIRQSLLTEPETGWLAQLKPKLKSFERINYPKTTNNPLAYVAVFGITVEGKSASLAVEALIRYKGRTAVMLGGMAASPMAAMAKGEIVLTIHELTPVLIGRAH